MIKTFSFFGSRKGFQRQLSLFGVNQRFFSTPSEPNETKNEMTDKVRNSISIMKDLNSIDDLAKYYFENSPQFSKPEKFYFLKSMGNQLRLKTKGRFMAFIGKSDFFDLLDEITKDFKSLNLYGKVLFIQILWTLSTY